MKILDAARAVSAIAGEGLYTFSTGDLARALHEPRRDPKLNATLRALVANGVLARPVRGVYVVPALVDGDVLEHIARTQRQHERIYVSYESAASRLGLISQLFPSYLSIATTGREGLFATEWGEIEYVHTAASASELASHSTAGYVLPMTDAEMTLKLMRRARRRAGLALVEEEEDHG